MADRRRFKYREDAKRDDVPKPDKNRVDHIRKHSGTAVPCH